MSLINLSHVQMCMEGENLIFLLINDSSFHFLIDNNRSFNLIFDTAGARDFKLTV